MRSYRADHKNSRRIRYGWRIAANGSHMIDHEQQEVITKIITMRKDGYILQDICDYLNQHGYPTPRNGKWYCSTVKKIIDLNSRPSST